MNLLGYARPDGGIGIRNHVAVIHTVECAQVVAQKISSQFSGTQTFGRRTGCYWSGPIFDKLVALGRHPNVAAVLVVGLGCEYIEAPKVAAAIARGEYARQRDWCEGLDVFGMYAKGRSGAVLINSCNFRLDHLDIRAHSREELEARRLVPQIAAFLRTLMPGFRDAVVSDTAAATGVRFTRWIDAGFDLTAEHTGEGARFDDVIGAIATFDRHPRGGVIHPPRHVELPYRIMLPQGVEELIVASGKSASTDPRGLIRGQVPCYVLGQAAGAAAALAGRTGTGFRELDIAEFQRELLRQGGCLGDEERLSQLGLS